MSRPEDFQPSTVQELCRFMAANAEGEKRPMLPAGGRTALQAGASKWAEGVIVGTSGLNQVVDYPARDMTITVGAGIRFDELTRLLADNNQRLPLDVPQSSRATLGGIAASNVSGPRRFGYGTMRDYVIGVAAVDASGRLFKAGGRVVKNVAGYDMCKMLVGSMGTLAVITEMTLKLKPTVETSSFVWAAVKNSETLESSLQMLLGSATRPVAVEVLNRDAAVQIAADARCQLLQDSDVLCVAYDGSRKEVDWQIETLKSELAKIGIERVETVSGREADGLWTALCEFQCCTDEPLSFQASVPRSRVVDFVQLLTETGIPAQAHAGNGIVIGHLSDEITSVEKAIDVLNPLRKSAEGHGGSLVVTTAPQGWKSTISVYGTPTPAWKLMKNLKKQLDPEGLMHPDHFI